MDINEAPMKYMAPPSLDALLFKKVETLTNRLAVDAEM
jgi:hypothetical protein